MDEFPSFSLLPAEIRSMIWTHALVSASAEAKTSFDSIRYRDKSAACACWKHGFVAVSENNLRHPFLDYFLVSRTAKLEVEHMADILFPDGLGYIAKWCSCASFRGVTLKNWLALSWAKHTMNSCYCEKCLYASLLNASRQGREQMKAIAV
jgi:hypothetical protein